LYFDSEVKNNKHIDQQSLEAAVVEELSKFKGISLAVSSSALRRGSLPDTSLMRAVVNNFNSKRSGDVFIVFEPNWFINNFDGLTVAATHGSPWTYDTHVPIVFTGPGMKPQVVSRRVHTIDIAITLAAYLNIKQPSGAEGKLLREVLK
jgi:predicted AlkP superfamily pyrophosphatase or phosphodiesterase